MADKIISFEELPNEIQMGRESALLGMYEKSLRHLRVSLQTIHDHIRSLSDPVVIESWQKVESEIKEEARVITDVYNSLDSFKVG